MKLYKYISDKKALQNIVSGKIKFSTIPELNDPTELVSHFLRNDVLSSFEELMDNTDAKDISTDLDQQEALFNKLFQYEMQNFSITSVLNVLKNTNSIDIITLESLFNDVINAIKTKCGVFCVSSRNNSLPMWAHYANNAQGFLIEFDGLENVFKGDKTGILNQLLDVNYTTSRSGVTFKIGSYKSIFFEKDSDWHYENEKRVITDLKSCISIGNSIHGLEIPKSTISKVIFGWKMNTEVIDSIKEELIEINDKLQFSIASVKNGYIEIQ